MIVFSDIGSDSGEIECGDSRFGAEYKTQRAKINNLIKDANAKLKGGRLILQSSLRKPRH